MILLKNLLFTVAIPGTVAVYLPLWLTRNAPFAAWPWRIAGITTLTLGAALYAWTVWDFAVTGRGTPAPLDAPKKLIVRGLYRYTRNPMYLGVLTTILGWALLFQAPTLLLYAALVATCFHLFTVLYEEPHLAQQFGPAYDHYRTQVPRWLPRKPPTP